MYLAGKLIVFTVVTFLHNLFTAVWIEGLVVTGIAALPAVRKLFGMSPQTQVFIQALQRRLWVLVYISIVVLIVTGALMTRRNPSF